MKSVGEILRTARLQKNLSSSQVASAIKTKEKNILAIEENNFSVFPADVFALSFVRDYADFLGLNPDEVTPYFRRTVEMRRQQNPKETAVNQKGESFLSSQIDTAGKNISKTILTVGTFAIIVVFVGFLIFEYQRNILHPQLSISSPVDNAKMTASTLDVKGKTDSENKIFVNGDEVPVGEGGEFETIISLKVGINKIVIKAINNYQKLTEIERFVLREKN